MQGQKCKEGLILAIRFETSIEFSRIGLDLHTMRFFRSRGLVLDSASTSRWGLKWGNPEEVGSGPGGWTSQTYAHFESSLLAYIASIA